MVDFQSQYNQGYEFGKMVISYEMIVLDQVYKVKEAINNAEYDTADTQMRVLKALLGETAEYRAAIEVLNEEYNVKRQKMGEGRFQEMSKEIQKEYVIEHLEIIRELLKSRKYALIKKVDLTL